MAYKRPGTHKKYGVSGLLLIVKKIAKI